MHYGPHNVIDAESAPCEYKCFLKSVLATPHLHELSTHDLMCKLTTNSQLQDMFPNLGKLCAIALVIPMSTADCERGFSALGRIETDLRNRFSSPILNALMLISVEGPDEDQFPFERTCEIWSRKRNKRLVL